MRLAWELCKNRDTFLVRKGQKRVGSVKIWERSKNITFISCMNRAGRVIPPMIKFSCEKKSPFFRNDDQLELYMLSNKELFMDWRIHLYGHTNPNSEKLALLIMYNH
ncbi:hypothetical protein PR048_013746 [Dryococelus australis]|uniref:Uncharacterized protein n=1 Tax=Dryococelus australis TaxID=614101 RepID=A0ABQ9HTV2_9NEOP|nr:hypothetical protein PR048_013746 [Dryococelus australis]